MTPPLGNEGSGPSEVHPPRSDQPHSKQSPTQDSPWLLLRVLERWFPLLPRAAQVIVALSILGLVVVYVLHGFIARTYVRGQLFIVDEYDARVYAPNYSVVYDSKEVITDKYGGWFFPLANGGLPGVLTIEIGAPAVSGHGPRDERVSSFRLIGPIPVYHALSEMNYRVLMYPHRSGATKVQVASMRTRPRELNGGLVYAADFGATAKDWDRIQLTQLSVPRAQGPRSDVLMSLESILVKRAKRSAVSVYFGFTLDGKPVSDTELLWDSPSGSLQYLFPVRKLSRSWLQVYRGEPVRYRDISANITNLVAERQGQLSSRGALSLELYFDEELATNFTLPSVLVPGQVISLDNAEAQISLVINATVPRSTRNANGVPCSRGDECQSGECYPGPGDGSVSYCLARQLNCAVPGGDGMRYGQKLHWAGSECTCVNPGRGGQARCAYR